MQFYPQGIEFLAFQLINLLSHFIQNKLELMKIY